MLRFAEKAAELLNAELESPITASDLDLPPDRKLGDFAFPCFRLAKTLRKAPQQIAKDLESKVASNSLLTVQAAGPYLNFKINEGAIRETILGEILDGPDNGTYGSQPNNSKTWVFEYSSPNVAKPFLIGHLRSTALGAALSRIAHAHGYRVVRINHLGDWGTQYGKLVVAIQKFGIPKNPTIQNLVEIYVRFHDEAEKEPTLEEQAREAFAKLEKGDPEITQLWEQLVEISKKEFASVYQLLNVEFDHIWGESHYREQLEPLLRKLKEKKLLKESQGAWIVEVQDPKGKELPPCLLQKKDGATIYATRDIAAAVYRFKKFQFDQMSYFVGAEQRLHFQQVFDVLRQADLEGSHQWYKNCEHVPFGLYQFRGMKMSTRKGNFVTLKEVLEQAKTAVLKLMESRKSERLPEGTNLDEIAEKVAIGAIVFHDLSTDPARDVVFELDRVITFEGDTGPYLQYAQTRCKSILRKASEKGIHRNEPSDTVLARLDTEAEMNLIKHLGMFPFYQERALKMRKPSQLTTYLIDLARIYGLFYRECQVITDDQELTQARLHLVEASRRVLSLGLTYLGIPLPDRM